MRRVTQRDVARKAGVSQATVSLVLTGGSQAIPAETLQRIRAAADELGYEPNRFAQALRTNRSMTIACVVPDITNPFYPALMRGIQSVTDAHSYDLIAVNTDGLEERERHYLTWARQGRVDAVAGVFFNVRATDFEPLIRSGIPVVRIESSKKRGGALPLDDIFVDSRQAALEVTTYLIKRGHRRIGMVAGKGGPQSVRIEGYEAAMRAASLAPDIVTQDAFSEEGGYEAGRFLLGREERPTAVFAANDLMAIGVLQAAREAGLSLPQDLSVVGFDDISAAKLVTPSLTTVAQYQYEMGRRAAQILFDRLGGTAPETGMAIEMPFQLVVRQSA